MTTFGWLVDSELELRDVLLADEVPELAAVKKTGEESVGLLMLLLVPRRLLLLPRTVVLDMKYRESGFQRARATSARASRLRNRLVRIMS